MKHDPLSFGRRAVIRRRADQARQLARRIAGECATAALCFAGMALVAGLADVPGLVLILGIGAALAAIVGLAAVSEA